MKVIRHVKQVCPPDETGKNCSFPIFRLQFRALEATGRLIEQDTAKYSPQEPTNLLAVTPFLSYLTR